MEAKIVWLLPCVRLAPSPLPKPPLQQVRHDGTTQSNLRQRRQTARVDYPSGYCTVSVSGQAKLDWLSFTFPLDFEGKQDYEIVLPFVLSSWRMFTAGGLDNVVEQGVWLHEPRVGFYAHKTRHEDSGITIQWSPGNPYALCEISGRGVDLVLQSVSVASLAQATGGRATRLDIAVDLETDITPEAFVEAGYSERIKSKSSVDSETGSTRYIGSRSGERMARVYRYFAPHPREKLLRVEVELKGDAAKIACSSLLTTSLSSLAAAVNHSFAWKSTLWTEAGFEDSKLPARYYDSEGAETLRWLNTVVVPSLLKAYKNGLINLPEWLQEHFPLLFGS